MSPPPVASSPPSHIRGPLDKGKHIRSASDSVPISFHLESLNDYPFSDTEVDSPRVKSDAPNANFTDPPAPLRREWSWKWGGLPEQEQDVVQEWPPQVSVSEKVDSYLAGLPPPTTLPNSPPTHPPEVISSSTYSSPVKGVVGNDFEEELTCTLTETTLGNVNIQMESVKLSIKDNQVLDQSIKEQEQVVLHQEDETLTNFPKIQFEKQEILSQSNKDSLLFQEMTRQPLNESIKIELSLCGFKEIQKLSLKVCFLFFKMY